MSIIRIIWNQNYNMENYIYQNIWAVWKYRNMVTWLHCDLIYHTAFLSLPENWRPSWTWSHDSYIYNYLCNQCISPLKLWVRTADGEVYSIQHYGTVICDRFPRFPPPIKLTTMKYLKYFGSGVKNHNPNHNPSKLKCNIYCHGYKQVVPLVLSHIIHVYIICEDARIFFLEYDI